jgi:hypothetical protein
MPRPSTIAIGSVFGKLTVQNLGQTLLNKNRSSYRTWVCLCACGRIIEARTGNLRSGKTQSCGCYHKLQTSLANKKYTKEELRLKIRWRHMRARCLDSRHLDYKNYGGRGISVADAWKVFENFLTDMGFPKTPELTLERVDNAGNYCKENCVWADTKTQSRNKRNNTWICLRGHKYIVTDVAKAFSVSDGYLFNLKKRKNLNTAQEAIEDWVNKQSYVRVVKAFSILEGSFI